MMPKEMVASIVAQELQNMTHWGGVRANTQCTLASKSRLKSIVESKKNSRQEGRTGCFFSKTTVGKYTDAYRRNDGKDDDWNLKFSR